MLMVFSRKGEELKVSRNLFRAVVQAVLIFGDETWFLNPRMERTLSSFQHMVVWQLTGRHTRRREEGSWKYPPLVAAMAEADFEEIGVYVTRIQNTVAQYIATRPIMDLCEWYVWRPVAWVSLRW